ncbi:MAG: magnesium/cobalt transporter CorA [Saprospiraceae bacterium]|jgi:magnesium transporter
MVKCIFREKGVLNVAEGLGKLQDITSGQVIWIDLLNPLPDERAFVEEKFEVELFTRQEAEEIESSSKYSENEDEINANLNYIFRTGDSYAMDPVSFILKDNWLITQRNIQLRSFDDVFKMLRFTRRTNLNGYSVFFSIFEARIDIEADFLEDLSKRIYNAGKQLTLDRKIDEEMLLKIYHFQELTILFREATSEIKRLFSSILRSEFFPKEEYEKLRIMIKDADSLLSHTSFNFERLEYLQNTFLGLNDMEQNKIIKIFTVVTVIFMPPTLIASIYGMNFTFMPELEWEFGYPLALSLMVLASTLTLWYFKRKNWL